MARVTYGGGITAFAGSIGGVTFQQNRSGYIAKLRSNPTVNPSALQAVPQRNIAYLVSYWASLSQADKDFWDAYAIAHDHTTPWGEVKTLSGYQWFLSCNLLNLYHGLNISFHDPSWTVVPAPDSFIIETSSTYIRAAWSPDYTPSHWTFYYMSLPLKQSSLKLRRSLFYVDKRTSTTPMTNYDLTSVFESLANVTWADFYASADCSIIVRIVEFTWPPGLISSFTSAIIKVD